MSKPKMYGMKTGYVPNAKADMRYRKKLYQRQRDAQPVTGTKPDTCISCGRVIPEGRLQCPACEGRHEDGK